MTDNPLDEQELRVLDAYWRAGNYLSVGQIYLLDNPLLREPLRREHVKPRLLGHWGTTPGLNFVYAHLNRVIRARDLDVMYVIGPGHGGPAMLANTWLEGSYTAANPAVQRDEQGMRTLFRQFSFPGGVPSHVAPEVPGSIHEGGELGYSLAHAYGAAFDNPGLVVACVVGDGEAETGPLAASWHANKFLDPVHDGAVLPILHLNGYKIANPTVLARIPQDELDALLRGYGYTPHYVTCNTNTDTGTGTGTGQVHQDMAAALDTALDEIHAIQHQARNNTHTGDTHTGDTRTGDTRTRPRWPLIVLRSPKGWTGPTEVDGLPVTGTWRAHQVPLSGVRDNPEHLTMLENWLRSYRPDELFDDHGAPAPELLATIPDNDRTMGANPHANGGLLLRPLNLPDFRNYATTVEKHGATTSEPTRILGRFLRDVIRANTDTRNFRIFGPDETASNRLDAVYETTGKQWQAETLPVDEHLTHNGRVVEVLSEHLCQGWLEGYLLTGRHGLFSCYEAFIHIVDSMFNQHAKWLKTSKTLPWRRPIASLNYLLTSHVWRQDHNGFSHQDPGFIDHVTNKKAEVTRVYLPPDTNTLLSVTNHCLTSHNHVNVIIAAKNDTPDWLPMDQAILHATRGAGIWNWAGNENNNKNNNKNSSENGGENGGEPDIVLACAGDAPTLETLAATAILREQLPNLTIRVVNVIDLMRLQPHTEHPHGMTDPEFDAMFTTDKPVIFAYHGYPWLIHRLTYRRTNHHNIHVRGYKEEGTTTTPFDMLVLNDLDRYRLVIDVLDRVPHPGPHTALLRQHMTDLRTRHHQWTREHGEDLPEIRDWVWPY